MQMVERVHQIIAEYVREGDSVVDATVGNGWDTLMLCEKVGSNGLVYGFDVQEAAIINTSKKLEEAGYRDRVQLFCTSHSEADLYIKTTIRAFMMNLGYLPGGEKNIVTQKDSTVKALEVLTSLLSSGGVGTVLVYYGHEGGPEEKQAVEQFMSEMPSNWGQITRMEIVNRKNSPPILYILEKK